jgi:hypothetical protein
VPVANEVVDEARTEFLGPHNQPTFFAALGLFHCVSLL